ncbi:MAG TPA: primosomal protein N' [Bacillota bacterium]|nr:primosomal protein N' [Bacillota bacterium]HSX36743.1 primosomal protein N' [Patescibacteria group bacterium]
MHFVEVLPGDASYHGDGPLTYSSSEPLLIGSLVSVPLRRKQILGIVVSHVGKPSFVAKAVTPISLPALPPELIELLKWMQHYYPAPLGVITQLVLPKALPKKPYTETNRAPLPLELPVLTDDQQKALSQVAPSGLHLLHGETGTGKTRVYIELAKQAVESGKSVIVLTPEIGLTSQLANTMTDVFGNRVVVLHSQLTDATRQRSWQYVLEQTKPLIVVGARSALFSPMHNLGLIVIDESHETAYKQDQAPYYHTTPVAAKLAALHGARVILGSATPLVSDYYIANAKKRPIMRMTETASKQNDDARTIDVVDLRDRTLFTKSPHLSNTLISHAQAALQKGEQILLFLNRRGTARVIFCERCGWQAACPHCDLPLIYHGDIHQMRCHSCEFKAPTPTSCPECHNTSVVYRTIGTKAVVEETERLFPEARIMRFDTDNKLHERIEHHYEAVHSGQVNILIGTQTLAKGLDLPKLGLVGVVAADSSLNFPDFSAQERTYQLLTQVIGRVGRGHRKGRVVLQTYAPDSSLLKAIIDKDWDTFYNNELAEREQFAFPPFYYLLKLSCKRSSSSSAEQTASNLAKELRSKGYKIIIEGPAPSFHEKSQNKFAWQLIIKARRRELLTEIIRRLPSGWDYDIDPMNLL